MPQISIVIPTYTYYGEGKEVLDYSFSRMILQSFKDFDVVISDDSEDDSIKKVCDKWSNSLDIKYYRNKFNTGAASNLNHAVSVAGAEILKILFQDDYLFDNNSMQNIRNNFEDNDIWNFYSYVHTQDRMKYYRYYVPFVVDNLEVNGTLGTPSALTMRKMKDMPLFDENLKYHFDCDFYRRMQMKYGNPKIVNVITMANYVWDKNISSNMPDGLFEKELEYLVRKYSGKRDD